MGNENENNNISDEELANVTGGNDTTSKIILCKACRKFFTSDEITTDNKCPHCGGKLMCMKLPNQIYDVIQ